MNVSLTDKQRKYIQSHLDSGEFMNASEVVHDALRLHELYNEKLLAELRAEILKGVNSGTSHRRSAAEIARDRAKELTR